MYQNPTERFEVIQYKLLKILGTKEPSLELLEKYFFDRKSKKVTSEYGCFISFLDLRRYIRRVKTSLMSTNLKVKSKATRRARKERLATELLEPVTDVLAVAAAVNAGVFSSFQIAAVLYRFSNLKFGNTLMDWGVHAFEAPLQVFLEEGLAPALVSTAQTATRDDIDPCWLAYLGLTDKALFSIVTYYLMFERGGVEELLHLYHSTHLLSGWKEQAILERLKQLSMSFPKLFGMYAPTSA